MRDAHTHWSGFDKRSHAFELNAEKSASKVLVAVDSLL